MLVRTERMMPRCALFARGVAIATLHKSLISRIRRVRVFSGSFLSHGGRCCILPSVLRCCCLLWCTFNNRVSLLRAATAAGVYERTERIPTLRDESPVWDYGFLGVAECGNVFCDVWLISQCCTVFSQSSHVLSRHCSGGFRTVFKRQTCDAPWCVNSQSLKSPLSEMLLLETTRAAD